MTPQHTSWGRSLRGPSPRALLTIVAIALLGTTPPAEAAEDPAVAEYGIRPGFHGDTTLPGGHFTHALEPGVSIDDSIEIFNFTDESQRFDLYGADLVTTPEGAFAPAARDADPLDSGAWITLDNASVEVPPRQSLVVPFTVTVPAGTTPGDHPGTIVVEKRAARVSGSGVAIQPRLALRVLLTVPGEVDIGTEFGALRASREDGGVRFTLPVRNTGNVTFTAIGTVEVVTRSLTGTDRIELTLQPPDLYAVPGGEATLQALWEDPPWLGRAQANAQVDVVVGERDPVVHTTETVTVWIVPWLTIAVALAALLFVLALGYLTRERRRTWLRHRSEERELLRDHRAKRRDHEDRGRRSGPMQPRGVGRPDS